MEYQHGGDVYSQEVALDFSANINPFGMPEAVRRVAAESLARSDIYPDSRCMALTEALASFHKVPREWVSCGNGAADLIFALAFGVKPARALVTAPAFAEYEQALEAAGCRTEWLDLKEEDGFVPDVGALLGRLDPGVDLLFLCNPNNPTGVALSRESVERLAGECRKQWIILAVDECFCEFLDHPEEHSVISLLGTYPNLFVLKAFTKLYAMAGLRLGYGLCSDSGLLETLARVRQPWSVSGVAQAAGVAALRERAYVERSRAVIAAEREWLKGELSRLGFKVYGSNANYIFFRDERAVGGPAEGRGLLYEEMMDRRILIRSCANYRGLDNTYYRICVRLHEDNQVLIHALGEALGARAELDIAGKRKRQE